MIDIDDYEYNIEARHKSVLMAHVMLQWTTEPPTKDGWYWAIGPGNPVVVSVIEGNPSHFVGFVNGVGGAYPVDFFSHWLGPLPIPEPPKE